MVEKPASVYVDGKKIFEIKVRVNFQELKQLQQRAYKEHFTSTPAWIRFFLFEKLKEESKK